MPLYFKRNLGQEPMQMAQDMTALGQHQMTGPRGQGAPAMENLVRPLDPADPEPARQLAGLQFSPAAPAAPPPLTRVADTPQQQMERAVAMSTNREGYAQHRDATGAMTLAAAVARPQAAQRQLDALRGASAGYQMRDSTGDVADAQAFANDQIAMQLSPEGSQVVDQAIRRLAQRPVGMGPGGLA